MQSPAYCLDESYESLYDLPLEELLNIKVVTSTKHGETLQTVPSSVTIFEQDEIRRMGINNLIDLMNFVPGYQSYRTDRAALGDVASSRGSRGGYAGRELLILMDGVRLNQDYSGGVLAEMPVISLDNVERVEFIRGPGSALYGSNAFLGVVNVITKGDNSLSLEAGSHQTANASLQTHWHKGDSEVSLYARSEHYGGELLSIYDPDPAAQSNVNARDPYRWQTLYLVMKKGDFTARIHLNEYESDEFYAFGYVSEQYNYWDSQRYAITLDYGHELSERLELLMQLQSSTAESNPRFVSDQSSGLGLEATSKERKLETNVTLRYRDKENINAIFGFEFREPDFESDGCSFGPSQNCFTFNDDNKRNIRGWYGQFQQRLNDHWRWIAGARYDNYSDFGGHFSPRLGLIHHIDDRNTIKLLYGEAFRAPSPTETDLKNNPAYAANPDLEPEVATTTELIFSRLLDKGYLQLTLFDVQIEDAIRDADTPEPKMRVNSGEESIAGVELEYRYQFASSWYTRAAITYLADQTKEQRTESDTLLGLSLGWMSHGWTATLNANYQSEKIDPFSPDASTNSFTFMGGRTLYSSHVAYKLSPAIEAYLNVDNLFDKSYLTPAERSANSVGVANSGRTFLLGLRWDY